VIKRMRSENARRATSLPARMNLSGRDALKRYGVALLLACLALLLRAVLPHKEGTGVFQLPLAAVVLSAWYGGLGPGLLTWLISVTGVLYLFIPPRYSFALSPDYALGFFIFVALSLFFCHFGARRRHITQALRASEERFRTVLDVAADALMVHDEDGIVVDVNRQACESLGYARQELMGMKPVDFDAGPDKTALHRVVEHGDAGEVVTFETQWRRKDGTVFPVEVRGRQFRHQAGWFRVSISRDISERKHAEESLREKDDALQAARTELARVSRLTTLGELTTSIAHEVSQPLGAMVASAGACTCWLSADPPALAEARAALDNIIADGRRAREVIARVRALTKRQAPRKDLLDINQEIFEVLALTERELRTNGIVTRTDLARTLPRVAGDQVQLQQVLLNLIVNATEAMSGVHDRSRELRINSRQDDPRAVLVEVLDSGTGLDAQRAEQIFQAFYTTKAEGIGIGLSISRSIVEAHGGRLWASPNEPHGAVFRFSLPVAQEAVSYTKV